VSKKFQIINGFQGEVKVFNALTDLPIADIASGVPFVNSLQERKPQDLDILLTLKRFSIPTTDFRMEIIFAIQVKSSTAGWLIDTGFDEMTNYPKNNRDYFYMTPERFRGAFDREGYGEVFYLKLISGLYGRTPLMHTGWQLFEDGKDGQAGVLKDRTGQRDEPIYRGAINALGFAIEKYHTTLNDCGDEKNEEEFNSIRWIIPVVVLDGALYGRDFKKEIKGNEIEPEPIEDKWFVRYMWLLKKGSNENYNYEMSPVFYVKSEDVKEFIEYIKQQVENYNADETLTDFKKRIN